jgi:hypothetical protein
MLLLILRTFKIMLITTLLLLLLPHQMWNLKPRNSMTNSSLILSNDKNLFIIQ